MIRVGDCREVLAELAPASVDAVVTDPPYGLEFMGKEWDKLWDGRDGDPAKASESLRAHATDSGRPSGNRGYAGLTGVPSAYVAGTAMQAWHERWATEALRVLKPGGHLLAFGGTRTYHRLACALEDAGFEIRDTICWLYGSGFPKSLDVSKAIDAQAGAVREVVGSYRVGGNALTPTSEKGGTYGVGVPNSPPGDLNITAPATDDARRWDGWGTALKPAHEPIVVARKPLAGTVAGNVLAHGVGALNIDGTRVGYGDERVQTEWPNRTTANSPHPMGSDDVLREYDPTRGRWPANVVLDEDAANLLDQQTGDRPGSHDQQRSESANSWFGRAHYDGNGYGDSGGPSRFFYVAKSSRAERNEGLRGFEEHEWRGNYGDGIQDARPHTPDGYVYRQRVRNTHPTVKPVALMRWLVRLVTPPGGLILDPFAGSGTTGIAAALEDFRFLGIEQDAEYARLAEARIAWWKAQPVQLTLEVA